MISVGRLAVKICGRDAGMRCVIVDILDDNFVIIDGATRRRKCNINHLELLDTVIKIKKKASHDEITKEFETLGLTVRNTKPKKTAPRPRKIRKEKNIKPAATKKS